MGTQPGSAGKLDDVRWADFPNRHGEARRRHPLAVRGCEAFQEACRPDGPDDLDRCAPRREIPVLPCEDQRGEVAVVVDMKMRKGDVADARPIEAELREPPLPQSISSRSSGASRRYPAQLRPGDSEIVPVPSVVKRMRDGLTAVPC